VVLGALELVSLVAGFPTLGIGAAVVLALFLVGLFGPAMSWLLSERRN
jgi:hypothetical protein